MAGNARAFYRYFKGTFVRAIFIIHAALSIYMLRLNNKFESIHWLLVLPLVFIFLDGVYVIYFKSGTEMEYVWPCGFFYIISIVPIVWIIEMGLLKERRNTRINASMVRNNDLADWLGVLDKDALSKTWSEIGIFLCLIVGRWFMPRSSLTREQLSALLLGYVGNAADILDLFKALQTPGVVYEQKITVAILAIYTLAVIQFSLITTSSFEEIRWKKDVQNVYEIQPLELPPDTSTGNDETDGSRNYIQVCTQSQPQDSSAHSQEDDTCIWHDEFYQIFVTIFMHDGPFVLLRLTLCIEYKVFNELHILFLVKNGMVIFLLGYRVCVLSCQCKHYFLDKNNSIRRALVAQLRNSRDIGLDDAITCALVVLASDGNNSRIVNNEEDEGLIEGNGLDEEIDDFDNPIVHAEGNSPTLIDIDGETINNAENGQDHSTQLEDNPIGTESPVEELRQANDAKDDIELDKLQEEPTKPENSKETDL